MKCHPAFVILTLALVFIPAGSSLAATGGLSSAPDPAANEQRYQVRVPFFTFDGGPVPTFVDQLKDMYSELNVVLMDGASDFTMPAVEVHNVTVGDLLGLINTVASGPPMRSVFIEFNPDVVIVRVRDQFRTAARQPTPAASHEEDRPLSRVYSLARLLAEQVEPADILQSVEVALEFFDDGHSPVRLRYHDRTRLLIVQGRRAQVELVAEVITELEETAPLLGKEVMLREDCNTRIQELHEQFQLEIERMRGQIARLEAALRQRDASQSQN